MCSKNTIVFLALMGAVQAFQGYNEPETQNTYLLHNDMDVVGSQTLSLNIEDPPNNVNINFRRHPKFRMLPAFENQRYEFGKPNQAQTSSSETMAELFANQRPSFSGLFAELSKQIQDTLSAQQQELKEAIEKSAHTPVSMSNREFDEHLNYLSDTVYADCQDALNANQQLSGVYILDLKTEDLKPFGVYCKYDDGKAWTIIQRRQNGAVDFNRNWSEYKNGFGNLNEEYWLGLDRIHALTSKGKHELWLQMETYEGVERSFHYGDFSIASEHVSYKLYVDEFKGENKEHDLLSYNNGMAFITVDSKSYRRFCAKERKGAWWYDNCSFCNPNGEYKRGNDGTGIHCDHFHEPMKYLFIAISQTKSEADTQKEVDEILALNAEEKFYREFFGKLGFSEKEVFSEPSFYEADNFEIGDNIDGAKESSESSEEKSTTIAFDEIEFQDDRSEQSDENPTTNFFDETVDSNDATTESYENFDEKLIRNYFDELENNNKEITESPYYEVVSSNEGLFNPYEVTQDDNDNIFGDFEES